jgi:hypothetical protein
MQLKIKLNINNIGLILTIFFLIVIIAELYFVYFDLFKKLTVTDDAIIPNNIVRVDLSTYNNTLDILDESETFEPQPIFSTRPNPMK